MRRAVFCVLGALISCDLVACSSRTEAPQPISIRVERLADQHLVHVSWHLPVAANALVFTRGQSFRSAQWDLQAGVHLEHVANRDVLRADTATTVFEADIHEGLSEVAGDYPFMMPFSDGGVALFTGHLDVAWMSCYQQCSEQDVAVEAGRPAPFNIILAPSPGENVVAGQLVSTSEVSPVEQVQGRMVYFGRQAPVKGPGYQYISDPKVPLWALREFRDLFPQVIDLISQRLGRVLPTNPTVLIPFVPGLKRLNSTYSGAVAGDSVLLGLYSDRWSSETTSAQDELKKLIAHESFHLWNATMYQSSEPASGTWLHEGSADAMAYQVLLDLGAISRDRFSAFQTEAINRCAVGLTGTSLPASTKVWNSRNHYDCGAVIELVTGRALKQQGSDLWMLWSKIFDQAIAKNGIYGQDDFFSAAQQLSNSSAAVSEMQTLANGQISFQADSPQVLEKFFIQAFADAGVKLQISDGAWPEWYGRWAAERALAITIGEDCEEGNWYIRTDEGLTVVGNANCRSLHPDAVIREIGGYSVNEEGVEVYDLMSRSCGSIGARLEMTSAQGAHMDFTCPNIPLRPGFLEFGSPLN